MIIGLGMFLWGQKYLHGHAEPGNPALLRERTRIGMTREHSIYLGALPGIPAVAWLMWAVANGRFALGGEISPALVLMLILFALVMAWFAWFILKQRSRVDRDQMLELLALILLPMEVFHLYDHTYVSPWASPARRLSRDLH